MAEFVYLDIALCQGWNKSGELVDVDDRNLVIGEVVITNYKVMILNPETLETICTYGCGKNELFRCQISNDEPVEVVKRTITNDHSIDDINITYNSGYKFLYNDTVTILIEADIFVISEPAEERIPRDTMREGMYSLYKAGKLTDMIIKCDGEEFKIHKSVLASQSPVFLAMFVADMREKRSGVVEVSPGITAAAMSDLVSYLYTGSAPHLSALAHELLELADRYQIHRLFKMCVSELQREMSVNSVVSTLIQADLRSNSCMKKACFDFLRLNSAKMFEIAEWEDLKHHFPSLYVEALEYSAGKFV